MVYKISAIAGQSAIAIEEGLLLNQTVQEKAGGGFIKNLCVFALDRRRVLYPLAVALAVLCCVSAEWAQVRENPDAFLPTDSETRQGLEVMREEFADLQTGRILVENVSAPQAEALSEKLSLAAGVQSVDFDERSGYRTGSALLKVTFRDADGVQDTRKALSELRFLLEGYDYSIIGDADGPAIGGELWLITAAVCAALLVAAALFVRVPALTELSVIALTFGAAFLYNSGTWFLSGAVSPMAAYLSGLLQLALCVICVGPLFRHCVKARARMSTRDAVIEAWSRTAPGAFCGGVTLLGAALALNLLHLRIGADPGLVWAKAVALTLVVFVALTPGLVMDLCEPLDRTPSRETEKHASGLSDFALASRFFMPFVLLAALIASSVCVAYFPRAYGADALPIWFPWGSLRAESRAEALFGAENEVSVLVPAGDETRESALLDELSAMDEVSAARGLANMETMGGYTLGERLTPRQFAELMDLDMDAARQIYSAYIEDANAYGHLASGVDNAAIPLAEMLLFACDRAREGYITLDWGRDNALELLYKRTESAVRTMRGADYSRLIVTLSIPQGSARSLSFLYTLRNAVGRYYPQGALFVGDAVRDADLSAAFHHDRVLFTALIFAIAFVALFTLTGSAGISMVAALVAQCGVWVTLSLFLLARLNLYFLSDLTLDAAQMGFGLTFAALLVGRWAERKRDTESRTALLRALRDASRPLTVSGVILALACVAAGTLAANRAVSSLALYMGVGVLISALLTLIALPQLLLLLPESPIKSAPDAVTAGKSASATARTAAVTAETSAPEVRHAQAETFAAARAAFEEETSAPPESTYEPETVTPEWEPVTAAESTYEPQTVTAAETTYEPQSVAAAETTYEPQTVTAAESADEPERVTAAESADESQTVTADESDATEILDADAPKESEGGARAYLRELLQSVAPSNETNAGNESAQDGESADGSESAQDGETADGSESAQESREKEASKNASKDI